MVMGRNFSWEKRKAGGFVFKAKRSMSSEKEIRQLSNIYVAAFNIFDSATPCTQAYSKSDIEDVLRDREMIKFVVYYEDVAIGLGLATTNLRKVPWINFNFYAHYFHAYVEKDALFYFKGLAIMPEFQNSIIKKEDGSEVKIATELCRFMANAIPEGCIVAFDCSEKMTHWLTDAILTSTGCFQFPEEADGRAFVDRQVYTTIHKISSKKAKEIVRI